VSLDEAKKHLDMSTARTVDDVELRDWILTASERVEKIVGPVARRTVVERHTLHGRGVFVLQQPPVISLSAVTVAGTATAYYDPLDLLVDPDTGIVRLAGPGAFGQAVVDVTYTAGRAVVPSGILAATLIILEHLWETQRGWVSTPTVRGEDPDQGRERRPQGFALPARAVELLEPYRQRVLVG
jgi:hypothetical protein